MALSYPLRVNHWLLPLSMPLSSRPTLVLGFVPTTSVSSNSLKLKHFRSSKMQAICVGCFVRQSICSVIYIPLDSSMSRTVDPQECLKMDVNIVTWQSGCPIPVFTFCSRLIEWGNDCVCGLVGLSWGSPVKSMTWLLPFPVSSRAL